MLLRGCDRLLPHALEVLAGSLAATGSDLASGVLEQVGEPEPLAAACAGRQPRRAVGRAGAGRAGG